MSDLTPLVQMARTYPDLLAGVITDYQERHHLDDYAMVRYLEVGDLYHLHLLCLCYRPETDDFAEEMGGLSQIAQYAGYLGCDMLALLRVVRLTPVHLEWEEGTHKDTWVCSITPYGAVIGKVTPTTLTAYVDGPNGRNWSDERFQDFVHARIWCERKLDQLAVHS